jgi:hypothetical protein
VEGLAEGKYVVRASKKGYSDDVEQAVESGRSDLMLQLEVRGGVSGFVRDLNTKKPVTEFSVRAFKVIKGRTPQRTKIMEKFKSKEGAYTLIDLEPGEYTFVATADGYADCSSERITVVRDYQQDNVDIHMHKGGVITGRVVNAAREPIPGVKVTLNDNQFQDSPFQQLFSAMAGGEGGAKKKKTFTKADGTFRLELIVPDTYQVAFSHEDYSPKAINDVKVLLGEEVTPSSPGGIMLTVGAKIHGFVRDTSQKPVPGMKVLITRKDGFMTQTNANKEGYYVFGHLNPGEYEVRIDVERIRGKPISNPFTRLIIGQKSKVSVFLEEGGEQKVDLLLTEG